MKNWRTTLFGIGTGVFNLWANGMTWKQAVSSVGIAAIGCLAKDFSVSGGKDGGGKP